MEKAKKPIKVVFFKGGHAKMWKIKKDFFFFAKIAWHYLCQEGRKNRIFMHTICFGQNIFWAQNSVNQEKL